MKKFNSFSLIVILVLIFSSTLSLGSAAPPSDPFQSVQIKQQKAQLAISVLAKLQSETKKISIQKSRLRNKTSALKHELNQSQKYLAEINTSLETQKVTLGKRIRYFSHSNPFANLGVLTNPENSLVLSRHLKIIKLMTEVDLKRISNITDIQEQAKVENQKIHENLKAYQKTTDQFQQKEKSFWSAIENQQKVLRKLKKEKNQLIAVLNSINSEDTAFIKMKHEFLTTLTQPSLLEEKGQLPWPLKGSLANIQEDSDQTGVFITAAEGTSVQAIFPGVVSFVGSIDGLGQTVIINHGEHFYSVYSHIQNPLVTEKTKISKNQKIATAGLDKIQNATGLYFEIRHFTEPNDPTPWMKGTPL